MVPARSRDDVLHVSLRPSLRYGRVLSIGGREEMQGKVGFRAGGYPAGRHTPSDGDGREHEREEAKDRDGKEDIHAPVRRITRCMRFVHFIRLGGAESGWRLRW